MVPLLLALCMAPLVVATSIQSRVTVAAVACKDIANAIGSSKVFYSGSTQYADDIHHWMPSAALPATCTVEPSTVRDVSNILRIVSKSTTSFAIKSGGHNVNPGASGSKGVLISMSKFNAVTCNEDARICDVGPGQNSTALFQKLAPYKMAVLGPRVGIVGVGGFVLGGGYAWNSNRHGLAIDSVIRYELVLPTGVVVNVTANENPDLFFGLKGGLNNFGIVTKFTMKAFPQGNVYGGLIEYNSSFEGVLTEAIADFAINNKDVDACTVTAFASSNGTTSLSTTIFYNGPTPPKGLFDKFTSIPALSNTLKTQSYVDYIIAGTPLFANSAQQRGLFTSGGVQTLDVPTITYVARLAEYYGSGSGSSDIKGRTLAIAVEPFIESSILRSNISATAWPHNTFWSPLAFNNFWDLPQDDEVGFKSSADAASNLTSFVMSRGQPGTSLAYYPNYSGFQVPLKQMYGKNLPRLKAVAAKYDPRKVMSRAGGFSFQ